MDVTLNYLVLPYIPLLPLVGALFAYLAGQRNRDAAGVIATAASTLAFVLSIVATLDMLKNGPVEHVLFNWFTVGTMSVDFTLRFDQLTATMCLVVTGIGSLIHLYSIGYMAHDESRPRFFAYLNLFMFAMLLLVMGGNMLVTFVGWEGVGLCSYLLIGFWHKNTAYAAAGMKAFVVNRIGDAGFLLGMFLLFVNFNTLDYAALKDPVVDFVAQNPQSVALITVIALALFVGACGKSAQIPLFVWLPDAMAGPTPVSALIHAATMVTAGVYLVCRMNFLYTLAPIALAVMCVIAIGTAFIGATIAITQNDIKKVLAYSTVSQLGYMFLAASVGGYWIAVFYLVTHAFFKACLFLGAGSVISGCHHEQDMRRMGGLWRYMPITALTYGVSVLAIAGIFPFAGYHAKHAIFEALAAHPIALLGWLAVIIPVVATATAALTAFYMTRSFAMTFLGTYRGHERPHESAWVMTLPLFILALLSTFGGLYLNAHIGHYLSPVLPLEGSEHSASSAVPLFGQALATTLEHLLSSWGGIVGIFLALLLYSEILPYLRVIPGRFFRATGLLGRWVEEKYWVDEIYDFCIVQPLAWTARMLWKVVDQGAIDGAVNATGSIVEFGGESLRLTQTGQVRHYVLCMFAAALFLMFFYLITV